MACNMTAQSLAVKSLWTRSSGGLFIGSDKSGGAGGGSGTSAASMTLTLSGAGRIGFYVDYSELSAAGTHRFWITRTHGTAGAVSVDYATSGDTHTQVSGTVTFPAGTLGVQYVDVPVSANDLSTHDGLGLGEHRITMTLSNPTNGAALHHGTDHTTAYGVIDNATMIASDANAVFFDADAGTNGTGTAASPYNNVYDAVANVGSKRYIYGRGTQTVDTTHSETFAGGAAYCLPCPPTRSSEATRCIVRNWPGYTLSFDNAGARTDVLGFAHYEDVLSYHTYKGMSFDGFNTTGVSCNVAAVGYYYGTCSHLTIEQCNVTNLNGSSGQNHAAFAPWGTDGCKIWRCTSDNIQQAGTALGGQNTAGVQSYRGINLSIQRCDFSTATHGVYQKLAPEVGATATVRFCTFETLDHGILYGQQGGTAAASRSHDYAVVQNNLFLDCNLRHWKDKALGATELTDKIHASNNVFYQFVDGGQGPIHSRMATNWICYNNIMSGCTYEVWDYETTSTYGTPFEYIDYNCGHSTVTPAWAFNESGTLRSLAQMQALGYATNHITSDPQFTNPATNDFTLTSGANAEGAGVSGTDMGLYLTGSETIGAAA